MLTQREVAPYLLKHNLIHPSSIVAGDLTVLDVSRRNRNFKVVSAKGPSYVLKQGASPDRVITVAREAAAYQLLHSNAQTGCAGLVPYLPRFYSYDEQERVLILELFPDAEDFRQYHLRTEHFSIALASM